MDYSYYSHMVFKYIEYGGPLIGIFFPILEAFFPFLPLIAFVIVNVTVFGFFLGYIYSWMGNCIGSFLLFLLIRHIGGKKIEEKIKDSKYSGILEKIRKKNFYLLFFLYCFPFSPSFLLSGTAALANMNTKLFLITLLPSKLVMIIFLAFIGENVNSFFEHPLESIFFIIIIVFINLLFKLAVNSYEKRQNKNN